MQPANLAHISGTRSAHQLSTQAMQAAAAAAAVTTASSSPSVQASPDTAAGGSSSAASSGVRLRSEQQPPIVLPRALANPKDLQTMLSFDSDEFGSGVSCDDKG